MKFIIILWWIIVLAATTVKSGVVLKDYKDNEKYRQYTQVAVDMVKRFISPHTNTLVIAERRIDGKHSQSVVLTKILQNLDEHLTIQLFLGYCNDRFWDYNLFIVDSSQSFAMLCHSFPITDQERYFNFFILLTWRNKELNQFKTMFEIFKMSFDFNVQHVVIMCYSEVDDYIGFYTYDVYSGIHCQDGLTIREVNRYENDSLQYTFLFPNTLENFNGCWLNVSAHIMSPLLMFNGDTNNKTHLMEINRLTGVEGDILKIVSKALNFKIRIHFPQAIDHFINWPNSSFGCFRDLEQNRAHVVVGGFSTSMANAHKFSTSYVYHSTQYVFVVRSGLCYGPFKQLLNPLCPTTWLFLFILFVTSVIFTKIVERKPKVRDFIFGTKNLHPLRSMFAIFLGNAIPTTLVSKRNFARFLLIAWLLLSFEVRNGYQGKMFDSLRFSPRIPIPLKISQLIEQDYTLLTKSSSKYYPLNRTRIMRNTTKRLDLLQSSELRLTTIVYLDTLAHYNYLRSNTSTLTYVEEIIRSYPCAMFFKKHSILRNSFDRKLKVFSDAGIISHIAKQHIHKDFQAMNRQSQFVSQLATNNLLGLYIVSVILWLISICIFVLEILSRKSKTLLKIMNVLNSL